MSDRTPKWTVGHQALDVVMMLVQQMDVDRDWLKPPEDGDYLRASLDSLERMLSAGNASDRERAAKIKKILWDPIEYMNRYECECGCSWSDTHTCSCDDECPRCKANVSPAYSTKLEK